jgi:hypothetical protein
MPKMKDLGINVIPETMRPPECLPGTVGPVCTAAGVTLQQCFLHTTATVCFGCTHFVTMFCGNTFVTVCTGNTEIIITINPTTPQFQAGGGLTHESIAQLKEQLQQQIALLDEHAKTIGPKTAAEIDARESQLKAELADLASRRSDLKKSK